MDWEEFIAEGCRKKVFTEEDINNEYKKQREFLLMSGKSLMDSENRAKRKVMSYYKKLFRSALEQYEIIIFGIDKATDFGLGKMFNDAKLMYETDSVEALKQGYVNEHGEPVYHGTSYQSDNRLGKPILLEQVTKRKIYGLVKKHEQTDWKEGIVLLGHEFCSDNINLPMFKVLKTNLFHSEKSTEQTLLLSSKTGQTKFDIVKDEHVNFPELAKKYLAHRLLYLPKIDEWITKNQTQRDTYFITKADDINQIMFTGKSGDVVFVSHDAFEVFSEKDSRVACWYPKFLPGYFKEHALDVVVIGRGYYSKDGQMRVNAWGIWVDKEDMIDAMPAPIEQKVEVKTISSPKKEELEISQEELSSW